MERRVQNSHKSGFISKAAIFLLALYRIVTYSPPAIAADPSVDFVYNPRTKQTQPVTNYGNGVGRDQNGNTVQFFNDTVGRTSDGGTIINLTTHQHYKEIGSPGNTSSQQEDYQRKINEIDSLIQQYPERADLYLQKANEQIRNKDMTSAIKTLENARNNNYIPEKEKIKIYHKLAYQYYYINNKEEAISLFEKLYSSTKDISYKTAIRNVRNSN